MKFLVLMGLMTCSSIFAQVDPVLIKTAPTDHIRLEVSSQESGLRNKEISDEIKIQYEDQWESINFYSLPREIQNEIILDAQNAKLLNGYAPSLKWKIGFKNNGYLKEFALVNISDNDAVKSYRAEKKQILVNLKNDKNARIIRCAPGMFGCTAKIKIMGNEYILDTNMVSKMNQEIIQSIANKDVSVTAQGFIVREKGYLPDVTRFQEVFKITKLAVNETGNVHDDTRLINISRSDLPGKDEDEPISTRRSVNRAPTSNIVLLPSHNPVRANQE